MRIIVSRRKCIRCPEDDPSKFYTGDSWCKECRKTHTREKYDHEQARNTLLKHNYGITSKEYDAMLAAQGGVCASCGALPSGVRGRNRRTNAPPRLVVDHDHVTGKVRGLLCEGCNQALGKLNEDIDRIYKLAEYIHRVKEIE